MSLAKEVLVCGRENSPIMKEVAKMGDRGRTIVTLPEPETPKMGDLLLEAGHRPDVAKLFGLSDQPGERTKRRSSKDRKKNKAARKSRRANRKK